MGDVLADEAYLRESITNPAAKVVEGFQPIMPSYQGQVSEEQLLQLIAYIRSLGATPQGTTMTNAGGGQEEPSTTTGIAPDAQRSNPLGPTSPSQMQNNTSTPGGLSPQGRRPDQTGSGTSQTGANSNQSRGGGGNSNNR
jgi:hypothetical protein